MSAILSAEDLNDFISPGVACIKPVETLPRQLPEPSNPYEVTTEDKVGATAPPPPAQISLTDCLACSGCVTSAEAVLVSLQSHQEVLNNLDSHPEFINFRDGKIGEDERVFVASVSPQTRASVAATYSVSEKQAGYMIEQLLSGPQGLRCGGKYKSGFTWVLDTNTVREICQEAVVEELQASLNSTKTASITNHTNGSPKLPILASACPGWICYAEKTHPHVLPHLSRLKSPQALAGTLLKSILSRQFGIAPDKVWHLAVMPCFDKKLEASREELTDIYWMPDAEQKRGVRDVDCVITARELLMLADSRSIRFPELSRMPVAHFPIPDHVLEAFLFPKITRHSHQNLVESGPSDGYAYRLIKSWEAKTPGSKVQINRGRNPDVVEYTLMRDGEIRMKTARYFGFRNIQNLVRKLKPQRKSRLPGAKLGGAENRRSKPTVASGGLAASMEEYAYVEVMACPGGCTNGGGQIKFDDVNTLRGATEPGGKTGPAEQKAWLARIDEAYYSADSSADEDDDKKRTDDEHSHDDPQERSSTSCNDVEPHIKELLAHWTRSTGIPLEKLLFTTYRQVDSAVGKEKGASDMERVAGLASSLGGGW